MKPKLSPFQQEMLDIYEALSSVESSMTNRQRYWFKILTEEADFTDLYNLRFSQRQMEVWRGLFSDLSEEIETMSLKNF